MSSTSNRSNFIAVPTDHPLPLPDVRPVLPLLRRCSRESPESVLGSAPASGTSPGDLGTFLRQSYCSFLSSLLAPKQGVFWKTGADLRRGRGWKRQHCRYDIGGSQGVLYLEVIPKGVSMRIETLVKETLDLQGFRVGRVDGGTDEIVVRIVADGRYAPRCGECGEKASRGSRRRKATYAWPSIPPSPRRLPRARWSWAGTTSCTRSRSTSAGTGTRWAGRCSAAGTTSRPCGSRPASTTAACCRPSTPG